MRVVGLLVGGLMILTGLISLPSLPDDIQKWSPVLGWLDELARAMGGNEGRWLLTISGLVLIGAFVLPDRFLSGRILPPLVTGEATDGEATDRTMADSQPDRLLEEPLTQPAREFVPPSVTVPYLTGFFEGQTDAQGQQSVADYIQKWMRVEGSVRNVQVFSASAAVILVVDDATNAFDPWRLYANLWFREGWRDRVRLLPIDARVAVIGCIEQVSKTETRLVDCELVE